MLSSTSQRLVLIGGVHAQLYVLDSLARSALGRWVWWIKDQIDRRWIAKFQRPPQLS